MSVAPKLNLARLPDGYLSVDQVAAMLECTPRYVQRRCDETWSACGLAVKVGNTWGISPRADKRLHTDAQQARDDLQMIAEMTAEGVSERHIEIGKAKRDVVRGFHTFRSHARTQAERRKLYVAQVLASGTLQAAGVKRFSVRSLQRWETDYEEHGIRGLVRKAPDTGSGDSVNGAEAIDFICRLVHGGNGIKVKYAINVARGKALEHPGDPAWRLGSYRSVLLAVQARSPKILRILSQKGERAAEAQCVPKRPRDYEGIASNAEWVGDERTVDVWCRVLTGSRKWKAIRPMLTSWNDMRSRMVVGWILAPHADSTTILGAFKRGCMQHGIPSVARVDWGADYKKALACPETMRWRGRKFDVQRVRTVMEDLEIEIQPTMKPYQPWVKPVESWYDIMKDHFDRLYASFWGGRPSERHEDRQRYIKENLEKLPTLEDLQRDFAQFLDGYHRQPHGAPDLFGKTPLIAMEAFRDGPAKKQTDTILEHLFRTFVGPRQVRRDGIKIDGRWYGHGDPLLAPHLGEKVLLGFQPDDASRAMVCSWPDKTPLFEIDCPPLIGYSRKDAEAKARAAKAIMQPYREQARRASKFLRETSPAEMMRLHRAGVESQHGSGEPTQTTAPRIQIQPALEEAISKAPRVHREEASKAIRTGTEDRELTVDDFLNDDPGSGLASLYGDGDSMDGEDDVAQFDNED